MEENEFTGIPIPEEITDPEIREYIGYINEALSIAYKKKLPVLFLAEFTSNTGLSVAMGCPCCIAQCITRFLDKDSRGMGIVTDGVVRHMINKQNASGATGSSFIEQLVRDAKKNTSAGN